MTAMPAGTLTRESIARRLPSCDGAVGASRYGSSAMARRGDHDLNPGMRPETPLTSAAVLIPLVDHDGGMTVLFTRRTDHLVHHAGQISFPGGHMEPRDKRPEDAALREMEEETGVARRHVEVVGRLDNYITRTGFDVVPVVGMVAPTFELNPDPREVAEVFEVPLGFFLDPANHQRHQRAYQGRLRHFYAMPYGDYYIWGATAGMLINLYDTLTGA